MLGSNCIQEGQPRSPVSVARLSRSWVTRASTTLGITDLHGPPRRPPTWRSWASNRCWVGSEYLLIAYGRQESTVPQLCSRRTQERLPADCVCRPAYQRRAVVTSGAEQYRRLARELHFMARNLPPGEERSALLEMAEESPAAGLLSLAV